MTNPKDQVDADGRSKVGRTVSVPGREPATVIQWGVEMGTPGHSVWAAVVMFASGELAYWDHARLSFDI